MFQNLFFKAPPRKNCPVCHYPTLQDKTVIQQCTLCKWNDDGQDDYDAMKVRETVNGDYSLFEARLNWGRTGAIYRKNDSKYDWDKKYRPLRKKWVTLFEKRPSENNKSQSKVFWDKVVALEIKLKN
jgi:hypothetical protein